jgi:mono/diheme cytochrome c family protein
MNEDTYSYRLLDADEKLWSIAKRDLRESQRIETSTMPSYDDQLTVSEVDNLVAYLFSLRTRESAP